jgi:hypothetical protein
MTLIYEEDLLTPEQKARRWRDQELAATDYILPLTDHPQRDDYIAYREALRQWPTLNDEGEYINDFPDTRPELGE